ncbi:hypothetical protein MMC07_009263 [Pseudocyphellaria aurata]|nr:hypothetical protein [Pseudocyphellaria aurata]
MAIPTSFTLPKLIRIDLETADEDLINSFVTHKFHQYDQIGAEGWRLWDAIQFDFQKRKEEHFAQLNGSVWTIVRDYRTHAYWLDCNYGPNRSYASIMVDAINKKYYEKWTADQIRYGEDRYHDKPLSGTTLRRKQELMGIANPSAWEESIGHGQQRHTSAANLRAQIVNPQGQDVGFQHGFCFSPTNPPQSQHFRPTTGKLSVSTVLHKLCLGQLKPLNIWMSLQFMYKTQHYSTRY